MKYILILSLFICSNLCISAKEFNSIELSILKAYYVNNSTKDTLNLNIRLSNNSDNNLYFFGLIPYGGLSFSHYELDVFQSKMQFCVTVLSAFDSKFNYLKCEPSYEKDTNISLSEFYGKLERTEFYYKNSKLLIKKNSHFDFTVKIPTNHIRIDKIDKLKMTYCQNWYLPRSYYSSQELLDLFQYSDSTLFFGNIESNIITITK